VIVACRTFYQAEASARMLQTGDNGKR
jgi:hypothetical protein